MNKWLTRIGIVTVVAAIALGAVGIASAQGPGGRPGQGGARDRIGPVLIKAVADATGLTLREIEQETRDGTTLAQLCEANDVDPQAILEQVTADITATIEQALADGKITQEQADTALAQLPDHLDAVMNAERPLRPTPIRDQVMDRMEHTLVGVLAESADMRPGEVLRDMFAPRSLAELAESYGLDTDALIAEVEARITEEVAQAVADGKLTQEQADQVLDGLHDRLMERFNNARGFQHGMFFGQQMRPGRNVGLGMRGW